MKTLVSIEIVTIKHDGELLFQTGDIMFDSLWALPEFEQGQLKIYRDGKLFDQTEYILEVGTHAAQTVFAGLNVLIGEKYNGMASALNPNDFQERDKLVLEIPVSQNWDFANHIRLMGAINIIAHKILIDNQEQNIGDLNRRVNTELTERVPEFRTAKIVRFCQ